MILEVCWDGLGMLSFGLSQLHGNGSWLVCGVALIITSAMSRMQWDRVWPTAPQQRQLQCVTQRVRVPVKVEALMQQGAEVVVLDGTS